MKNILFILTASLFILIGCGAERPPTDIINPEAEYRYFFGGTCPHCQELNRIAESKDLYSQISIEKREVYQNQENQAMFLALIEELDVEGSGVPFVYDTVSGEIAV
jgi:glutaredoxin